MIAVLTNFARCGSQILGTVLDCDGTTHCLDIKKERKSVTLSTDVFEEGMIGLTMWSLIVWFTQSISVKIVFIGTFFALLFVVSIFQTKSNRSLLTL